MSCDSLSLTCVGLSAGELVWHTLSMKTVCLVLEKYGTMIYTVLPNLSGEIIDFSNVEMELLHASSKLTS